MIRIAAPIGSLLSLLGAAAHASGTAESAVPVRVNRTVPSVERAPLVPGFSAAPTEQEIRAARVFGEPVVAVGGSPPAQESRDLAQAMLSFLGRSRGDDDRALRSFLDEHPESAYRASLLLNFGMNRRRHGGLSSAREALRESWELSKAAVDPVGIAVADRAIAEWAELNTLFGDLEELDWIFAEIGMREIGGSAGQKVKIAREGREILRHKHEFAVPSATVALGRLLARSRGASYVPSPALTSFHATPDGASLVDLRDLAASAGFPAQVVFRESGAIPVPAVVHLRVKHYSAVVRQEGDLYLLDDPILGGEVWVSRETLLAESSGYFLVAVGALPEGTRRVDDREASLQRGKCYPCGPDPDGPERDDPEGGKGGPKDEEDCKGLAAWGVYKLHVSLHLADVPLSYSPPRGPRVAFRLDYNQRETHQPALFSFSNVGRLWTHDWIAYLEDDPTNPSASVTLMQPGGGIEVSVGFDSGTGSYARDFESRVQLVRTSASPIRYERRFPDGSVDVYAQADGAATAPRRVFRTEEIDPQGQKLTFVYDASLRLVSVVDAIGQVTTLSYELAADPLRITKVTDPFGRFAQLDYEGAGRLRRINDVIGLESTFAYGSWDFVRMLETPYGQTKFEGDEFFGFSGWARRLEVEDPLGGRERFEWDFTSTVVPTSEPSAPAGFAAHNTGLELRNSFYWDKRAMSLHPGDYLKAEITHWLALSDGNTATAVVASEKKPLEGRVWYAYPGQSQVDRIGTATRPSRIARLLDGDLTEVRAYEYNEKGNPTRLIDPLGRTTLLYYEENGTDLSEVRQRAGTQLELLRRYTYSGFHRASTSVGANGMTTSYSFNADGRLAAVISPARAGLSIEERTTAYNYFPDDHPSSPAMLQSVVGPSIGTTPGVATNYTYDDMGRVRTIENLPDGIVFEYEYDAMDRVTKVRFADATFIEVAYSRLDPVAIRNRLGRLSYFSHDALRRRTSITDEEGRVVRFEWCDCDNLEAVVLGNGTSIRWQRDLRGRITRETVSPQSMREYEYSSVAGRLIRIVDAIGQEKHFEYALDGRVVSVTYTNSLHPTSDVEYSYVDPTTGEPDSYGRLRRMIDGTGATTYSYYPIDSPPSLGAGELATVDGPLPNDTISFQYDELGRVASRAINGIAATQVFDSLGRLAALAHPVVGSFTTEYEGSSERAVSLSYPNGQRALYSYAGDVEKRRLSEIRHELPNQANLSRFELHYGSDGQIARWVQARGDDEPRQYRFTYDDVGRLLEARWETTEEPPEPLTSYFYTYDETSNWRSRQINSALTTVELDESDRLVSMVAGGSMVFHGVLNEPSEVEIDGQPASVSASGEFVGSSEVESGVNEKAVIATDSSANARTNVYEVVVEGINETFQHDANGNLVADGVHSYEWDAANRLVAVVSGANRSEFSYNGHGDLVRVVEKVSGLVVSDRLLVGCDEPGYCEERDGSGATVLLQHFGGAIVEGEGAFFTTRDHLGSVRDVTDSSGFVRARMDYDPYGNRTSFVGDKDLPIGFAGLRAHLPSGLLLARSRAYSPALARWLSRDPAGVAAGMIAEETNSWSHYAYAAGNPVGYVDSSGLLQIHWEGSHYFKEMVNANARYDPWTSIAVTWECKCNKIVRKWCLGYSVTYRGDFYWGSKDPSACTRQHEEHHRQVQFEFVNDIALEHLLPREGKLYESRSECDAAGKAGEVAAVGEYGQGFLVFYTGEVLKDLSWYGVRDRRCELQGPPW